MSWLLIEQYGVLEPEDRRFAQHIVARAISTTPTEATALIAAWRQTGASLSLIEQQITDPDALLALRKSLRSEHSP